jgi:hypothetical protein
MIPENLLYQTHVALHDLVYYIQSDPTLFDDDDDGTLHALMCNANTVLQQLRFELIQELT